MAAFKREDYFSVPIENLVLGKVRPFPLYLYLELNQHLILLRHALQDMEQTTIDRYQKSGIKAFLCPNAFQDAFQRYLKAETEEEKELAELSPTPTINPGTPLGDPSASAVPPDAELAETESDVFDASSVAGLNRSEEAAVALDLINNAEIPIEQKQEVLREITQKLLNQFFSGEKGNLDGAHLTECQDFVKDLTSQVIYDEKLKHIYLQILNAAKALQGDHSVRVSTFSVLFGMGIGIVEPAEIEALSVAGLFHDVGVIRANPETVKSHEKQRTEAQRKEYEGHVLGSVKILKENDIPTNSLVETIIMQHHEHHDGRGYPKRISGKEINPLATIASIADHFDYFLTGHWDGEARSPDDAFATLIQVQANQVFEPEMFQKIRDLVESSKKAPIAHTV